MVSQCYVQVYITRLIRNQIQMVNSVSLACVNDGLLTYSAQVQAGRWWEKIAVYAPL